MVEFKLTDGIELGYIGAPPTTFLSMTQSVIQIIHQYPHTSNVSSNLPILGCIAKVDTEVA